jgi:hypothetical protein
MADRDNPLYKLVFSSGYLEARSGPRSETDGVLSSVDPADVQATARLARRRVFRRGGATGQGLGGSFPMTFAQLAACGYSRDAILVEFLASAAFDDFCDVPYARVGVVIEEAFYSFLSQHEALGDPLLLDLGLHETLIAVLRMFAANKDPAFITRLAQLEANGVCRFAANQMSAAMRDLVGVAPGDNTVYFYAQAGSDLILGPLDSAVVDLVRLGRYEHILATAARPLGGDSRDFDISALAEELVAGRLIEP